MEMILDAGFCLPAIASRSGEAGGDTGSLNGVSLFLSSIKHPVTSIIAFIEYRFIFTQSRKAGKDRKNFSL
jgi:hypothetical protein